MRILVGCEESQIVTEAFIAMGHDAMSCDLHHPGAKGLPHYRGNVLDLFGEQFDLFIAHPPCTRLTNSGVRWLAERNLWRELEEAAEFFLQCLYAPFPRIAVENPIMHRYARRLINVKYSQIIQPWQYGHGEQKATCLWLKGLPKLKPTNIVEGRKQSLYELPPSDDRSKLRSRTYEGIARAMASQWGAHLTPLAPDVWDSAAFSSIFLAWSFSCSQTESTPAHTQVTQTVRRCHSRHLCLKIVNK